MSYDSAVYFNQLNTSIFVSAEFYQNINRHNCGKPLISDCYFKSFSYVKCCKIDIMSGLGSLAYLEAARTCLYVPYARFACLCVQLWSDSICERLNLLSRPGYIRHHMKNIAMGLQYIFLQVELTRVEEKQTGRLTCPASEQVNNKSGSALWMSLVG